MMKGHSEGLQQVTVRLPGLLRFSCNLSDLFTISEMHNLTSPAFVKVSL